MRTGFVKKKFFWPIILALLCMGGAGDTNVLFPRECGLEQAFAKLLENRCFRPEIVMFSAQDMRRRWRASRSGKGCIRNDGDDGIQRLLIRILNG